MYDISAYCLVHCLTRGCDSLLHEIIMICNHNMCPIVLPVMFYWLPSLVPTSHPLMRRNGLVSQVEFLGLTHTLVTVSPCNVYPEPAQNRYGYSSRDNFTVVREALSFLSCFCLTWGLPRPTRKDLLHTVCTCTAFYFIPSTKQLYKS